VGGPLSDTIGYLHVDDGSPQPTSTLTTTPLDLYTDEATAKHSLSRKQVLNIFAIKAANADATQEQIAHALGVSQATVSRWLRDHRDTTEDARNLLQSGALLAASRALEWVESDNPKASMDATKTVLKANKLLDDGGSSVQVGLQIVVGGGHREEQGQTTLTVDAQGVSVNHEG
jgi:DNA-binding transcriptional regulator YiaG